MSFRDEIDIVIEEEFKKQEKLSRRQESMGKRKSRALARQHPTYFAVLIGKLLFRFRKPSAEQRRKPVTPKHGIEGYVDGDFYEKPNITKLYILKKDIQNLFHGKSKPKIPTNSNDKWNEDWKDYFEGK